MQERKYKRDEKYHIRDRGLYALVFSSENAIYVGQSVDIYKRQKQHQARNGLWNRPFQMIPLQTIQATQAEAMDYETAWRLYFQRKGFRIYGKPPGIIVNPRKRATIKTYFLSHKLKAPTSFKAGASGGFIKPVIFAAVAVASALVLGNLVLSLFVKWH